MIGLGRGGGHGKAIISQYGRNDIRVAAIRMMRNLLPAMGEIERSTKKMDEWSCGAYAMRTDARIGEKG
jgi:hypothetical protein